MLLCISKRNYNNSSLDISVNLKLESLAFVISFFTFALTIGKLRRLSKTNMLLLSQSASFRLSPMTFSFDGKRLPHNSHLGDLTCSDCHKMHMQSKAACQNCHDFEFLHNLPAEWQKVQDPHAGEGAL